MSSLSPFQFMKHFEKKIDEQFKTLSDSSGPFLEKKKDVTWAAGIEMECTYVLNPLDTKINWEKSFRQFYVPDGEEILTYIENKGYSKEEKYKMLVEAEASGRECRGIKVVDADPRNSMFEIATQRPYQAFRSLGRASDVLWYALRISDLQLKLIEDLNEFYNVETLYKKKKEYYSIVPYPFAMTDRLVNADVILKNGKKKKPKTNYTGSYHITLTLPFQYNFTTLNSYFENYKRYINQFQWIEPLVLAMYSTLDMRVVGTGKNYPRASYRIMLVGWGNPAGSDVRKFEEGLTRKVNIPLYWRKGLNFIGQKKLQSACADPKKKYSEKYVDPKRNVYDMGSDFRTPITIDVPEKYLKRLSKEQLKKVINLPKEEKWKVVGKMLDLTVTEVWQGRDLPPEKLFGVEMRILDYFPPRYMPSMLRMLIFIAENSRRTPNNIYVYEDKDWISSIQSIMKNGWKASLTPGYISKLEKQLDLNFPEKPLMVEKFYEVFLKALHKKNMGGFFVKEMLPERLSGEKEEKVIPFQPPLVKKNVNRDSWDFAFLLKMHDSKKLVNTISVFIDNLPVGNSTKKTFEKTKRFLPKEWRKEQEDIFYFFSLRDGITIKEDKNGFLNGISFSVEQKKTCFSILDNLLGEIIKLWPELVMFAKAKNLGKNGL
jgi:hypothetical protein